MLGFLLIDKPLGLSSHDVVYRLRKRLGTKKIGHAGTLDPMATGLLVIAVGGATRFLSFLQLDPKEYFFTVAFGKTTDTYDAEGKVMAEVDPPHNLKEKITECLGRFIGDIDQMPPIYSAIKKDGRPLYDYARKGEEVERSARRVRIEELTMTALHGNVADFRAVCSSGTYVRSIAHDLGEAVGCGAHATAIRRTLAGRFSVTDAAPLESTAPLDLIDVRMALEPMPCIEISNQESAFVRDGRPIALPASLTGARFVFLSDKSGEPLGIAHAIEGALFPKCMLPREDAVAKG